MKPARHSTTAARPHRRRLTPTLRREPQKIFKPLESAVCTGCGAAFSRGRWHWLAAPPAPARETLCPACRRVENRNPGGYLRLSGPFQRQHREEILHLARYVEARQAAEHPLRRIMSVTERGDAVVITTTMMELARAIGNAITRAYDGVLRYRYTDRTDLLRLHWKR